MEKYPVSGALPSYREEIRPENGNGGKYRGFAVFLICCGLLVAAFAVSAVFGQSQDWKGLGGMLSPKEEQTTKETMASKDKAYRALLTAAGIPDKRLDTILKVTNLD